MKNDASFDGAALLSSILGPAQPGSRRVAKSPKALNRNEAEADGEEMPELAAPRRHTRVPNSMEAGEPSPPR